MAVSPSNLKAPFEIARISESIIDKLLSDYEPRIDTFKNVVEFIVHVKDINSKLGDTNQKLSASMWESMLKHKYQNVGWNEAMWVSDQRDGDFIRFAYDLHSS